MLNKLVAYLLHRRTRRFRELHWPKLGYLHLFGSPGKGFATRVPTLAIRVHHIVHVLVHFPCLTYTKKDD